MGKGRIVSVVGAGGKTSYIQEQARQEAGKGERALILTTTKMYLPTEEPFVELREKNDIDKLRQVMEAKPVVYAGSIADCEKMGEPEPELWPYIFKLPVSLLIEADGAKRMPCKVPREREPVILPETTLLVGVLGLDALNRPIKECCFSWKLAATILSCEGEHRLGVEDVVKLILSKEGLQKGRMPGMSFCMILNKADDEMRVAYGRQIRERLKKAGMTDVQLTVKGRSIGEP